MSCKSCCKCFEQADGTIVKRSERDGAFIYTLPDMTVVTTAPVSFISTTEVDCAKFDMASLPPRTAEILEEVDVDGKQTGVLVRVIENADGSLTYVNLSDGSAYVAPAGSTLHTSEDTDYNERTVILCDEGTDVISTLIFKDGDIADVISTTITKLDGSAHVLSGNETAGTCAGQVNTDQEVACFVSVSATGVPIADQNTIRGYIRYTTNASVSPSVTSSEYFKLEDDSVLTKYVSGTAGYKPIECC